MLKFVPTMIPACSRMMTAFTSLAIPVNDGFGRRAGLPPERYGDKWHLWTGCRIYWS